MWSSEMWDRDPPLSLYLYVNNVATGIQTDYVECWSKDTFNQVADLGLVSKFIWSGNNYDNQPSTLDALMPWVLQNSKIADATFSAGIGIDTADRRRYLCEALDTVQSYRTDAHYGGAALWLDHIDNKVCLDDTIFKTLGGQCTSGEVHTSQSVYSNGNPFEAVFELYAPIERAFTAFSAIVLPQSAGRQHAAQMLDTLTLSPELKPIASNVPGLAKGFNYPLLNIVIPGGAPKGDYELVAAFFDPSKPISGRGDAFLDVNVKFTIQ